MPSYINPPVFDADLDLGGFEIQNAVIHNLAAAPTSPDPGLVYFDTVLEVFRGWDGTAWVTLGRGTPAFGSVQAQTAFGSASGDGAASTYARSDHKHGTPAHNAAAHAAIKLSDLAAADADVALGANKITGLATPTASTDAATKAYVDTTVLGIFPMAAVELVSTTNITLSAEQVIDGVTTSGNRVLVVGQTDPVENGIYVTASGAWSRASDANGSGEIEVGSAMYVTGVQGTGVGSVSDTITVQGNHAGQRWICYATESDPWVPGTDEIAFTQWSDDVSYTPGLGLAVNSGQLDAVTALDGGIDVSSGEFKLATDVGRCIAVDIGDGTNDEITLSNLNYSYQDAIVQLYDNATGANVEGVDVVRSNGNLTFTFANIPASNAYRAVIFFPSV
jgi:hypothetical protein